MLQVEAIYTVTRLSRIVILKIYFWWPKAAKVRCDQRPQHLRGQREPISGRRPPQFVVAKCYNIVKVTEPGHSGQLRYCAVAAGAAAAAAAAEQN